MSDSEKWYIVKTENGSCQIITEMEFTSSEEGFTQEWGPMESHDEATAKKIGLIRSGKCQPI